MTTMNRWKINAASARFLGSPLQQNGAWKIDGAFPTSGNENIFRNRPLSGGKVWVRYSKYCQEFQVPKMEVLNFVSGYFGGWVFPYISHIHTPNIGEDSSILGTTKKFGENTYIYYIYYICSPIKAVSIYIYIGTMIKWTWYLDV